MQYSLDIVLEYLILLIVGSCILHDQVCLLNYRKVVFHSFLMLYTGNEVDIREVQSPKTVSTGERCLVHVTIHGN